MAKVKTTTDGSKDAKKSAVSKSSRAGLTLSIARLNKRMKSTGGLPRVGATAPVYLTAVLEYIAAEIMNLAAHECQKTKRKRITPEDLSLAIRADQQLNALCSNVAIYSGDKIKNISRALVPKHRQPGKAAA